MSYPFRMRIQKKFNRIDPTGYNLHLIRYDHALSSGKGERRGGRGRGFVSAKAADARVQVVEKKGGEGMDW